MTYEQVFEKLSRIIGDICRGTAMISRTEVKSLYHYGIRNGNSLMFLERDIECVFLVKIEGITSTTRLDRLVWQIVNEINRLGNDRLRAWVRDETMHELERLGSFDHELKPEHNGQTLSQLLHGENDMWAMLNALHSTFRLQLNDLGTLNVTLDTTVSELIEIILAKVLELQIEPNY